jgi:hypothetical protein
VANVDLTIPCGKFKLSTVVIRMLKLNKPCSSYEKTFKADLIAGITMLVGLGVP